MRLTGLAGLASLTLLAVACGGDDGGDTPIDAAELGNPGFPTPTMVTRANMKMNGVWTDVGEADWTCLGTASSDMPSTQAISLSGLIEDFQTGMGVGGATVTAFPGIELSGSSGGPVTSDSTAATKGAYSMTLATLPSGTTRYGFKIEAPGYVKTYLLNQYFNPANATQMRDISAVSESTATALPAFVGVTRDPTKGVLAGAMRDCQGREVSNAVATVSSTAGTVNHLPGAKTFYFSAGSSSLPVRPSTAPVLNKDGLFVVLDLPPQTQTAYMQVWGFRNAAELSSGQMTLLAELAAPVEANAVITASVEVKRQ